MTIDKVYRSSATYPTDTDVHNAVIPRAGGTAAPFTGNVGPTVVNWFGHGAFQYWANASPKFLQGSEAAGLTNSNGLSVYLMMTCQTGYFI